MRIRKGSREGARERRWTGLSRPDSGNVKSPADVSRQFGSMAAGLILACAGDARIFLHDLRVAFRILQQSPGLSH